MRIPRKGLQRIVSNQFYSQSLESHHQTAENFHQNQSDRSYYSNRTGTILGRWTAQLLLMQLQIWVLLLLRAMHIYIGYINYANKQR